ncbi:hypothetical protein OF83DRAFT_1171490 [Amylostereum chailletii]|nr:hypothetical protein OF83DRAFT_1171490 [Amylostereum chailletii]
MFSPAAQNITTLPPEVVENALALSHPRDVARFAQTCRHHRRLVSNPPDNYLWRSLYLAYPFDDPRKYSHADHTDNSAFDWSTTLKRRVAAEGLASDIPNIDRHLTTVLECIHSAPPVPIAAIRMPSKDIAWATKVLKTLSDVPLDGTDPTVAELRAYIAHTFEFGEVLSLRDQRRASRAFIYDLRNNTKECQWGPFLEGGEEADWLTIQAAITVVTMNLRDFAPQWPTVLQPASLVQGLEATRPYSAPLDPSRLPNDWAGVEGGWMRVVCFCDYRDLIRFNSSHHNPGFFTDDFEEASRLLRMSLHVESVEDDPEVLAMLPDPTHPPIKFTGTMGGFSAFEKSDRGLRGSVRVVADGNVRWSFVSIYDNEDQWSSEGVQIGGPGSAAGVVGTWTGANHVDGDPTGPFWMFKTSDAHSNAKIQEEND